MEVFVAFAHLPAVAIPDAGVSFVMALAILGGLHHLRILIRFATLLLKHVKEEARACWNAALEFFRELIGRNCPDKAKDASDALETTATSSQRVAAVPRTHRHRHGKPTGTLGLC